MKIAVLKKVALTVASVVACAVSVSAQDSLSVSVGADLVSRYVWRGMDQASGVSVQPAFGLAIKGLSLSAWGNCSVSNVEVDEIDLTLSYAAGDHFTFGLTDYFWMGASADYGKYADDHFFELNLAYYVSDKVPLSIAWNTMLMGGKSGELDEDGDRMFSTYVNLGYAFDVHGVALEPAIGFNLWESQYHDKFSVMDITLKASKEIKITEHYSLPVFAQVIVSPAKDKAHLVFGISF
ncbi:MAG: hypothetical protein MJZ15_09205 [Bacteroidales bacterium]|nr:hypothetical protein [Bacteroidales bacterium]